MRFILIKNKNLDKKNLNKTKFDINNSLTPEPTRGWPKLAAVQKGPSHTLNTQFDAQYNQPNELASIQSITHLFKANLGVKRSVGHGSSVFGSG